MRSVLCIIAFVIFGNLIHYAKAEGGSDAPPYRIDSEGNKVVDYIAELESKVDNLTMQVHGLESKL